jgi:Arc/MetJ-type ribon-helix-helix transcriptional regulator
VESIEPFTSFDDLTRPRDDCVMTISFDKGVQEFLQEQVRAGICASAGEFVNDLLRSVREGQRTPLAITPELEAWLLASADDSAMPLTRADFDAIRERVKRRMNTPSP